MVVIYAVGDIMLGEQPLQYGAGVKSVISACGPGHVFQGLRDIFHDGDIVLGNLESPISPVSSGSEYGRLFFRGDAGSISGLANAGFNFLSIANNHMNDHGIPGFKSTVESLAGHGIVPVGIHGDIRIADIRGTRIAFLGYSMVPEGRAGLNTYNHPGDIGDALDDIRKVRGVASHIIVMLHWGCEYVPYASPGQVRIGRLLADGGADIIIGSHPHVLQAYEKYNGKLIAYSLGNFISDHTFIQCTRDSMALRIEAGEGPLKVEHLPIVHDRKTFCPRPASGKERISIEGRLSSLNGMLASKTTAQYSSRLGDYGRLARACKRRAKADMALFFAGNVYRYPYGLVRYMLKGCV